MTESQPISQEREQRQQIILYEDDLMLKYRAIAEALGVTTIPPEIEDWLIDQSFALERLLMEYSHLPLDVINMEQLQEQLQAQAEQFAAQTSAAGNIPVVISFDPLLVHSATYVIQENRVSIVSPENDIIDLAGNPKGKSNRFPERTVQPNCGAGKTIEEQLEDICVLLTDYPPERIRMALVDGSIISGRTLLHFLSRLPPELRENGVLAITGSTSQKGIEVMQAQNVAVSSTKIFDREPQITLSVSDLVPTLGGRMIARAEDGIPRPYTTQIGNRQVAMAVDPILGGYPRHIDIDPFETPLLEQMRQWSIQTGYGFWDSLERLKGSPISWEDVAATNGTTKIMIPVRQGMSASLSSETIPAGPKQTILAAARFGY